MQVKQNVPVNRKIERKPARDAHASQFAAQRAQVAGRIALFARICRREIFVNMPRTPGGI